MSTPNEVSISGERHLIIHGQHGNLQAKIDKLANLLKNEQDEVFLPYLVEIEDELGHLREYYPDLDGGYSSATVKMAAADKETITSELYPSGTMTAIKNRLRDMRALADAAFTSYSHEGTIACHLKVMFDEAWNLAAEEAGIDIVDGIPF